MTPNELHSALWQAIEDLGTRCTTGTDAPMEPCDECDACQSDMSAAQRALFQVIFHHRPEPLPTPPEGKPLFPGWQQNCMECQRRYPCTTVADVGDGLCVEWGQCFTP